MTRRIINLSENTRVQISIATFIMLISAIISGVVFLVNWKAEIENKLSNHEAVIIQIQSEAKETEALLQENKTALTEMKIDLKWIRSYMEGEL